jgi:hypothetical protein
VYGIPLEAVFWREVTFLGISRSAPYMESAI